MSAGHHHTGSLNFPLSFIWNLALAYLAYWLCRLIYWAENAGAFTGFWSHNTLKDIFGGAWKFDTSAILYTNVLYAFLMLVPLPWKWKGSQAWQNVAKWLFMVVNGLAVCINLMDAAYFPYTGRRTTTTVFQEFQNEGNLMGVFGVEVLRHWYLVLAAAALIALLWKGYKSPSCSPQGGRIPSFLLQLLFFVGYIPLSVIGMRGGATTAVRPITISNANQYVSRPAEAAVILNTPFSLIRTIGKAVFVTPEYFSDEEELEKVYSPVHKSPLPTFPKGEGAPNVVVLIVESFGREYIGALNETLEGGKYQGYTPFVDELCDSSATFRWSFCNGRKSIDGMPSILSGIPMFIEPFFLTPASMNEVGGLAQALGEEGYETAFFHGAENGSMGFQAFARKTGFQHYYGRTEYNADPRFGGDADFDGMWAIWDEPFLQFYAQQMSALREPFMTAVFTASSHHPYKVPEAYRDTFPEEGIVIHKCIRYTDHALRRFFDTARQQPWFRNTLFVLTSDHTNLSDHAFYQTDLGGFCSPILFYDPSGQLFQPGRRSAIAQQTDIMPSVLGLLGYDKPFVAFGCDLFHTPPDSTWAVNYNNGTYQYVKHDLLLQFDPSTARTTAVYALSDSLLHRNLLGQRPEQPQMERELKAIIQQYMSRMNSDRLTPSPKP
ncbi:MAG: LTA synthase family protein [Bacteroidaceae bacterium]|nr:LTA synthase family protein [Bacteroidaceae bacterium]